MTDRKNSVTKASETDRQSAQVVEEQATVHKRKHVTGAVRVHTRIHEDEQPVEAELSAEKIEIERIPLDRFVEGPIPDRQEGDATIVSVIEEVAVLQTRLKLVEEVRITRRTVTRHMEDTVRLRRQEVVVERDGPSA